MQVTLTRRQVNYWRTRLDNIISDYRTLSLSIFNKLGNSLSAVNIRFIVLASCIHQVAQLTVYCSAVSPIEVKQNTPSVAVSMEGMVQEGDLL